MYVQRERGCAEVQRPSINRQSHKLTWMKRTFLRTSLLTALLATIGCDRITKHWAAASLPTDVPRSLFHDLLRLQYAENRGAFLSFGANWPPIVQMLVFTLATGAMLAAFAMAARGFRNPIALTGALLLIAGGCSNLIDRIFHDGAVIDFLNVGLGPLRTGIFNVADVAIIVGALLMVVAGAPRRSTDRAS